MIAQVIYLLCLAGSVACAWLLLRSYAENRTPLLFWSAVCFVLLGVNNVLVVADLLLLPSIDLVPIRRVTALLAVSSLLFGFIWRSDP